MGTICTQIMQKDEGNETMDSNRKNMVQWQGSLAENISVDLIFGHYRQCRGEALLVIIESKNLQHCDPLKEYTNDSAKSIEVIHNMRKAVFKPTVNKGCPYKKIFLCIMPNYSSSETLQYQQMFVNGFKQALEGIEELTLEFTNTIEGVHTLPNQLIMGLMFKQLISLKPTLKLNLLTMQRKMMSFYRYELMKTDQFVFTQAKQ